MRTTFAVAFTLCAFLAVTSSRILYPLNDRAIDNHPACSKECIKGQEYWCQNITTSRCCSSTSYCISHKWKHMQVPEDHDSICNTCKNMVQEARDQLESNETQKDLMEVFKGTCALIHIKPIVEECDKLVDQFVPDLIETLVSQLNPLVVCSVAGLCNSAHIDKLLEEYKDQPTVKNTEGWVYLTNDEYNPDECSKCYSIVHHMEDKLNNATRYQVFKKFLNICGKFSSFSDACSSIVTDNFNTIYNHLKSNFNSNNICHLSGQCSARFHVHKDEKKPVVVEVRPLSSTGVVDIGEDLPCELCEQLVGHLRDLLVANTTESEFQQVLCGLCKQTKSFATECLAIVNEYYPQIYEFLTKNLNRNVICQMASLCPAPGKMSELIWPLVSQEHAETAQKIMKTGEMQLPFDKFNFPSSSFVDDTYCSTCEFVLYHLKKNVRVTKNKDEIRSVLGEMKGLIPNLKDSAEQVKFFLDKYIEALTELISEEKNFSEICSLIAVCPNNRQIETWEQIPAEFTMKLSRGKHSCLLCQLAVTKIYDYIQDNRTEKSIQVALDKLCIELMPKNLKQECVDLVQIYSKELIQMLLKDMTAEKICEELKFCKPETMKIHSLHISEKIIAVPKNNVEGKTICALCEYVLHFIQQAITDPKAENDVTRIIKTVCNKLPKSIQNECKEFVDTYGSVLVSIIAEEVDPSQVCPMIHVCPSAQLLESYRKIESQGITEKYEDKSNCPLCLLGVTQLYSVIKNNKTKESIEAALEKLCTHLPKSLVDQCDSFVRNYSTVIIDVMIADFTPEEVCVYLQLCDPSCEIGPSTIFPLDKDGQIKSVAKCALCNSIVTNIEELMSDENIKDLDEVLSEVCNHIPTNERNKCKMVLEVYEQKIINILWEEGPQHVCSKLSLCSSNDFLLKSFNGRTTRQTDNKNLGTKPCTWGESYWCVNNQTAEECKATEWCKKIGRLNESSTSTTVKSTTSDHELASEVEQAVSEAQQSS